MCRGLRVLESGAGKIEVKYYNGANWCAFSSLKRWKFLQIKSRDRSTMKKKSNQIAQPTLEMFSLSSTQFYPPLEKKYLIFHYCFSFALSILFFPQKAYSIVPRCHPEWITARSATLQLPGENKKQRGRTPKNNFEWEKLAKRWENKVVIPLVCRSVVVLFNDSANNEKKVALDKNLKQIFFSARNYET